MKKNIIFDFGGVLYNIDFRLTFEAFEKLGITNFEQMFSQFEANTLFQDLETGRIRPAAFYEKIKNIAPQPLSNEQVKDAWNALLLGYRTTSLDFLISLKEKYNLFLLSNTNQIHYDHFAPQLQEQTKYTTLESFFTKAYYSHEVGMRKPNKEVFEFVLNNGELRAEETLFIDDSFTNFPEAENLGIKTHLLKPGQYIEQLDYDSF